MRLCPGGWGVVVGPEELGDQEDEGQMAADVYGFARLGDDVGRLDTPDRHGFGCMLLDPETAGSLAWEDWRV